MPLIAAFEVGLVFIAVVVVALPIAALVFARGAGSAFDGIGKGPMSIDDDLGPGPSEGLTDSSSGSSASGVRDEEIRQMVQARSYRREQRGESALDVDVEVKKLLDSAAQGPRPKADSGLREEIRGLVIARNERRGRAGKQPLDVDAEIDRQIAELENLGQ